MPGRTALIVVDMLNRCEHADAEPLMESVRERLPAMRRLVDAARERAVLAVCVNDNHGDWSANGATLSEHALAGPHRELVESIVPAADVPFVIKARHSIFYAVAHIRADLADCALRLMERNMRAHLVPADAGAFS